jgi:hypothetical protein
MFLQSAVVPVCLYTEEHGKAVLQKHLGTAFFVGKSGYCLTARHVLEQALSEAKKRDCLVGLGVKGDNGKSPDNFVAKVDKFEFAPAPYDIAAAQANYYPNVTIKLDCFAASVWQEIAALGYPESAAVTDKEALWMNIRGYRGYVQRATLPRDLPIGKHPNGYELSFLLGPGSSGAPIFTIPEEILIGVGVGSYKSEHLEDELLEVSDAGKEYRERRLRIEQFGFAHDVQGVLEWRAEIFEGRTLREVATL